MVTTAMPVNALDDDRKNRDEAEESRTEERDAVHDRAEKFLGVLARTNARNETAAPLEIFRDLLRIERDRGIEIREHKHEQEVERCRTQVGLPRMPSQNC